MRTLFSSVRNACDMITGFRHRELDESGRLLCKQDPTKLCISVNCPRVEQKDTQSDEVYIKHISEELYREMNHLERVVYDKIKDLLLNSKNSKEMNTYVKVLHSAIFDALTEWDLNECKTQTRR